MTDYGDFDIFGSNWDFLFDERYDPSASTPTAVAEAEMREAMREETVLPGVAVGSESNQNIGGRFKTLTSVELKTLQDCRQSVSTKKNTRWGVKLFQEWSVERKGQEVDFPTVTAEELNEDLQLFYAEAQPKNPERRTNKMSESQAKEYHKNTFTSFRNVRSAINRHLKDINRDIDIVRDKSFRQANSTLDGKLKFNLQQGLSRPTAHKQIIDQADQIKISDWLHSETNPVFLRYRVWYDLAVHFVTRGLEFHQQLSLNSFEFHVDENGQEYANLTHETRQKNRQGGLDGREAPSDKRIYATGAERCPVKSLRLLISKTDPSATSLFNHCSKAAISSPDLESTWYVPQSVKPYQFSRFCADICRNSKCTGKYTAHSIRATGIQAMNDAGFELRHIMYMSGHRNESSVRSYSRECSSTQKHHISNVLSSVAQCNPPVTSSASVSDTDSRVEGLNGEQNAVGVGRSALSLTARQSSGSASSPLSNSHVTPFSVNSSNFCSSGFISNSNFTNCVFQFTK